MSKLRNLIIRLTQILRQLTLTQHLLKETRIFLLISRTLMHSRPSDRSLKNIAL